MGQKVNPNSFRFGITKSHNAKWITSDKKKFVSYVIEDHKIRTFIDKHVREYLIGKVEIHRNQKNNVSVFIHSAKVGALLGQKGENLNKFIVKLHKYIRNQKVRLNIQVVDIKNASLNARLVAESIATQLERRGSYRSAQKFAIRNSLRAGAQGIKTQVSGRLNGADMARTEGYTKGIMSLHTLRQKIDYATATARTTYGAIGIKVWLSKGSILDDGGKGKNVTT